MHRSFETHLTIACTDQVHYFSNDNQTCNCGKRKRDDPERDRRERSHLRLVESPREEDKLNLS